MAHQPLAENATVQLIWEMENWKGGRVVECDGLENRFTSNGNESSNLSLSAETWY